MASFTVSQGIQWTPPAAAANSGNSTLSSQGTEEAQSVGSLDVQPGTSVGTVVPVPFGAVDAAKVFVVQNLMSTEVGIRLNGAPADNFTLGPGQRFSVEGSEAGTTLPLTSVDVVTTADPAAVEKVNYWVLGD